MTTSPPRHCAVHCLPHNGSLSEVAVRAARVKDWKRIDRIVYVKTSSVMVCWGYVGPTRLRQPPIAAVGLR
ncbi:hypothetical protein OOU_Y34scaffold00096g2 [Pyricularia oryzae Y34]|uniref:Uncharacterized protein n=2 Tax=Pyricularia oryzae TaxID=318829 RepID=A0AA97P8S6_PYRO3|nr:hypothetical protein OOU_Y34scaffold00096g2 [Pyricularia oryzae Y34]